MVYFFFTTLCFPNILFIAGHFNFEPNIFYSPSAALQELIEGTDDDEDVVEAIFLNPATKLEFMSQSYDIALANSNPLDEWVQVIFCFWWVCVLLLWKCVYWFIY